MCSIKMCGITGTPYERGSPWGHSLFVLLIIYVHTRDIDPLEDKAVWTVGPSYKGVLSPSISPTPHPTPPHPPTHTHTHPTHPPPHPLPPGQDDIFKHIFLNENVRIPISNFTEICSQGSNWQNKPALVQVLTWRRTGAKPFPELMLTQFTDAYMRH